MKTLQLSALPCGLVLLVLLVQPLGADSSTSSTSKKTTLTSAKTTVSTTTMMTSTLTPEEQCNMHNNTCEECVKDAKCMFCYTDHSCQLYPTGKVLPPSDMCALDQARWGVCWVNFEALIISMSVIGGVLFLTIFCCCVYCCCCRGKNKKKFAREDAKYESQSMDRRAKQDERRSERKSRLDEIRRKYGLVKDDAPYQRFENA